MAEGDQHGPRAANASNESYNGVIVPRTSGKLKPFC
jgi:hypothetical protein